MRFFMGRLLGIDYGLKRTGIAYTDDLQLIASALETVPTENLIPFIEKYQTKYQVSGIVLGFPCHLDGNDTHATPLVRELIKKLNTKFPHLPVFLENEFFTSKIAAQTMGQAGKKIGKANKHILDQISATLILQSFLNKKK